jgi:hypothetical protein
MTLCDLTNCFTLVRIKRNKIHVASSLSVTLRAFFRMRKEWMGTRVGGCKLNKGKIVWKRRGGIIKDVKVILRRKPENHFSILSNEQFTILGMGLLRFGLLSSLVNFMFNLCLIVVPLTQLSLYSYWQYYKHLFIILV